MVVGDLQTVTEKKHLRKGKADVNEKAPLLPKTVTDSEVGFDDFNGASFSGAVFNLCTSTAGSGIMALPATLKELGMLPGILAIIFMAFLTEKSIEFMVRFTRAGNSVSYGGLMGESFGNFGKALVQISLIINNLGTLIVYTIIIGKIMSKSLTFNIFDLMFSYFYKFSCLICVFIFIF